MKNKLEKLDGFMGTESGKSVKRGRPVVTTSKRQERETAKAAKIAAGIEIKRGRPKGSVKPTAAVAE
jgi:hypothetical protein